MAEKALKVSKVRSKYSEWWLAFDVLGTEIWIKRIGTSYGSWFSLTSLGAK